MGDPKEAACSTGSLFSFISYSYKPTNGSLNVRSIILMKNHLSTPYLKTGIEILELEENSYHVLIPVSINGIEGDMIIDTGASVSVLDQNLFGHLPDKITSLKMQSGSITGEIDEVRVVCPEEVKIGNIQVNINQIAIIDLNYINEMYYNTSQRKIIGLLGSDFCVTHQAVLNYRAKTFRFKP